jgi:hypothetical protein
MVLQDEMRGLALAFTAFALRGRWILCCFKKNVQIVTTDPCTNLRPQNRRTEWLTTGSARFISLLTIMENARFSPRSDHAGRMAPV